MSEELPSQPAAPRFPGAGSPPQARKAAANIRNSSTGPSCSSNSPGRISLLQTSSSFPCLSSPTFRILCEGKSRNGLQIPGAAGSSPTADSGGRKVVPWDQGAGGASALHHECHVMPASSPPWAEWWTERRGKRGWRQPVYSGALSTKKKQSCLSLCKISKEVAPDGG